MTDSRPDRATIDFETRSACDIRKRGSWVYSEHETTEVMCLAFRLPHWAPGRTALWHPAYPHLGIEEEGREDLVELFAWIALGGLVEAHNAFFERAIWINVCVARLSWPSVPEDQWRCSAAKCSAHNLPRDLATAAKALGLAMEKDMEGRALMLKVSKPRKPLKAERADLASRGIDPDSVLLWRESREDFERLWAYCRTDVLTEEAVSEELPDLTESETLIWLMDQRMNVKGVLCDVAMARSALQVKAREVRLMEAELADITGGAVTRASQRSAFVAWINAQGVPITDTQGGTLDKFYALKGMRPDLRRALFIVREANRTSTAKYEAMLDRVARDGRIRDLLMYHGAGTGRWSGKGVQVHNFPRGDIKDMDLACEVIGTGDHALVSALYGNVMKTLSGALRGALMASAGRDFLVADYAAIEARCVFWLARDGTALKVFERRDTDIYCDMATGIYGFEVRKKTHPNERQFGKQAILGLGFGMGFMTFLLTCRKYQITFTEEQARRIVGDRWGEHLEYVRGYLDGDPRRRNRLIEHDLDPEAVIHELVLMRHTVEVYRARYPEVVQMWADQEAAAIAAVRSPGRRVTCNRGRNTWVVEGRFLKCYLPSGRALHYCDPKVVLRPTPWGDKKAALTFMGVDPFTRKWTRLSTYGGSLVENITQATARDLMAEAMVAASKSGVYEVIMSVHDELVCECDEDKGDLEEFERMMAATPAWAAGCPVEAEGWRGKRYRK